MTVDELLPDVYRDKASEYEKGIDTMDAWFDSGSSWAAVLEQRSGLSFPADLYLEGTDQHRVLMGDLCKSKFPSLPKLYVTHLEGEIISKICRFLKGSCLRHLLIQLDDHAQGTDWLGETNL
ncbi:hypothetical protein ACSBR1_027468 [Camellia fascicularis]